MPSWDDTDYAPLTADYAAVRRADPEVGAQILSALGSARTVINVGAGTGSYEPEDRYVVAVEPSPEMRSRRPPGRPPAIDASADRLPFDDAAFDAGLAILTIHHWTELDAGLRELRRVSRQRVVVLTADPDALSALWLATYAPEFHAVERGRYPSIDRIAAALGADVAVHPLAIPLGCRDGFADAYYGRPEALLDPRVRRAQSAWSFVDDAAQGRFEHRLRTDLASGAWDAAHGHLRTQPTFEGSMRILVAQFDDGSD